MTLTTRKPRRARSADAARTIILDAAAKVFAQKGYHGTTVDDIAQGSGYSPAALYKHFENKEDLFRHLWKTIAARIESIFEELNVVPAPFDMRIRWLLSKQSQILLDAPDMLIAFMAQKPFVAKQSRDEVEQAAYDHYRAHFQQYVDLMQQGIDEGVLGSAGPEDYANLWVALLQGYAYKWVTDGPYDIPEQSSRLLDLFMNGAAAPKRTNGTAHVN